MNRPNRRGLAPLKPSRRSDSTHRPHQQSQIGSADGNEQPLQDIAMTTYVHATHATGFIQMGIDALQLLAPLSLQSAAALASHSPPIPIHRTLAPASRARCACIPPWPVAP